MRLLELFSGTGSVGDVAKAMGYEVVSLDMLMRADIQIDILEWDFTVYPPGFFDVVHASPPCTEYSIALTTRPRDINKANTIVLKCLAIIEYFKPKHYIIENPQTGLLKKQSMMIDIPYNDLDYCKYGMPYRKRTRIWNNIDSWTPKPLCKKDCDSMDGNKHKQVAQRIACKKNGDNRGGFKQSELYMIPSELIYEIFNSIATTNN
jgi:hypothetical protein